MILIGKKLINLLSSDEYNCLLFAAADKVREKYVGNVVHLRGLIEFSNICKCNCLYCGLRTDNNKLTRYRLEADDVIALAKKASELSFKTVVLQSGEDLYYDLDKLSYIVKNIKKMDLTVTLSIGERSFYEIKVLREAGADRYLLRIETTNDYLYSSMHPDDKLEARKETLKNIATLGYEVGSGCLVGLPGQTTEMLADDILFFKEINCDMIGIGPLIVHPDTPLKNKTNGSFTQALKVMALTRLLLPDINIPATTAMETIKENGQLIALQSGANVVMPNITDTSFRKHYEIYPGKGSINQNADESQCSVTSKIHSIGRTIGQDYGFRFNIALDV